MRKTSLCGALFAVAVLASSGASAQANGATGRWKTIDDQTGKAKSIVEITQAGNGTLTGRIVELLDPSRPNPTCDKCKDDRKDKPITGMEIIRGMKVDGAAWSGGTILKPDEGKVYKSKMELVENGSKLKVSGCVAFICKSQLWERQPVPRQGP